MLILFGCTLIFAVFVSLTGYLVIMANSALGDFDFPTSSAATQKIVSVIQGHKKSTGVLYDLGSSYGNFALLTKKFLPRLEIHGLDNSGIRILWSKFKTVFAKAHPSFLKIDMFAADISTGDIVYIYLPSDLMPALRQKLQKELKPGSMVITNTVFFNGWSPVETYVTNTHQPEKEKIFVYQN